MAKLNSIYDPILLTAAQAAVLSAAIQRQDGAIILPARLKEKAASALGSSLIAKGLAREVRTKLGLSAWRQDAETGKSYALSITKSGRVAIMAHGTEVENESAGRGTGSATSAPVNSVSQPNEAELSEAGSVQAVADGSASACQDQFAPSPGAQAMAPRPDSKLSGIIWLLARETGATIADLIAATGWLPHTTRAALTGLRKRGFAVTTERQRGVETTYRIRLATVDQVA